MTLLDRVSRTIGGPVAPTTPNPSDQDAQQRRQEEEQQQRGDVPRYPHPNEPAETRAEHGIEEAIGREIRPAPRIPSIVRPERPFPKSLQPGFPPALTRAGAMMKRKLPSGLTHSPPKMNMGSMSFTTPSFKIPHVIAAKNSRLDPFRAFTRTSTFSKNMDVFSRPKKRRNKGWF